MELKLRPILFSTVLFVVIAGCITGCTARGYSGPVRQAAEISTITLSKVGEVSLEHLVFDDRQISSLSDNVELLSGNHNFRLYYRIESQDNCHQGDVFCIATVIKGVCEGHLNTLPGRTYLVTVENKYSQVDVHVSAKGYFDFSERSDEPDLGGGTCRVGSTNDVIY